MLKRTMLAIAVFILLAGTSNLFAQDKPSANAPKAGEKAFKHQRGGAMPAEMQQKIAEYRKKTEEKKIWVTDFTKAFGENDKPTMTTLFEKMDKIVDADKKVNEERIKTLEQHAKANEEKMKADPEAMKAMEQRRKQIEEKQAAGAKADPNTPDRLRPEYRLGRPGMRTGQFETWYKELKTAFKANDTAKMGQLLKEENTRQADREKRIQQMQNAGQKGPRDGNVGKKEQTGDKPAAKPQNDKPNKGKKGKK